MTGEKKKPTTFRQVAIGVVGTAATALVTLGVTSWSESVAKRDKRVGEMIDRVEALEADRSKWQLLAEHETRLREAEISTRVHQALLERLHPVLGDHELAAQQKAVGALLDGAKNGAKKDAPKKDRSKIGPPAPKKQPETRPAQQALPRLKVDADDLRRQYQRGPVKRIKKK